jgi:hypothetical protein
MFDVWQSILTKRAFVKLLRLIEYTNSWHCFNLTVSLLYAIDTPISSHPFRHPFGKYCHKTYSLKVAANTDTLIPTHTQTIILNRPMEKTPDAKREETKLMTIVVEARLNNKDYKGLAEVVELIDKYKVKKPLRLKAWFQTGLYWQREGAQSDAIISLNSARVLSPLDTKILTPFFESFNHFLSDYRDVFSQEDLELLSDPVESLLEFYKAKGMWDSLALSMGKHVRRRINYIKRDAKSAVETKASYQVERIVKALRENVTIEQVREEYARIMAPVFWELIAKEAKEYSPEVAASGASAGGRNGKDDIERKPRTPKKKKSIKPRKSRIKK